MKTGLRRFPKTEEEKNSHLGVDLIGRRHRLQQSYQGFIGFFRFLQDYIAICYCCECFRQAINKEQIITWLTIKELTAKYTVLHNTTFATPIANVDRNDYKSSSRTCGCP